MANFLKPEAVAKIHAGIEAGLGLRAIARATGIAKNTVKRYMPKDDLRLCGCGSPVGHRGWCGVRYAASASRQALIERWHREALERYRDKPPKQRAEKRPDLAYPFLERTSDKPEHVLLRKVNAAVPNYLPPHLRADICQDLIVGILSGEIDAENLAPAAKEMTKRVRKMFPDKFGPLSLDAEMPGTDGLRLIDTLSTEDAIWNRV